MRLMFMRALMKFYRLKKKRGLCCSIICVSIIILEALVYFQTEHGPSSSGNEHRSNLQSPAKPELPIPQLNDSIPEYLLEKVSKLKKYRSDVKPCPRICPNGRITPTVAFPDPRTRAVQLPHMQTPPKPEHVAFMPLLSTEEKLSLLYLMDVLVEILEDLNVDYFIDRGTLLGVVRHRGMIPWDDDVDVTVSVRDWRRLQAALCCLEGMKVVTDVNTKHWHFFKNDSVRITSFPKKRFPFVDIFFYDEDDSYIWSWGVTKMRLQFSIARKSDVFPVTTAMFEGKMYKVPRLYMYPIFPVSYTYGNNGGNMSYCESPGMIHRFGHYLIKEGEKIKIPCSELSYMYTFYNI